MKPLLWILGSALTVLCAIAYITHSVLITIFGTMAFMFLLWAVLILVFHLRNWWGRMAGYGECMRCGATWNWAQPHTTIYVIGHSHAKGCFPLCEHCWTALTIEQRLPYYQRQTCQVWPPEPWLWPMVERAVKEGK